MPVYRQLLLNIRFTVHNRPEVQTRVYRQHILSVQLLRLSLSNIDSRDSRAAEN